MSGRFFGLAAGALGAAAFLFASLPWGSGASPPPRPPPAPPPLELVRPEAAEGPFRFVHTLPVLAPVAEPAPLMPEATPAPVPPLVPPPVPPPDPPPYALRIPVAGVASAELRDTFDARRSGGRTHRALDILAPTGTPVLAAAAGHIVRVHESALGGLTLYQVGPDSAWVFYYAHLDAYAPAIAPGLSVVQGDTLGFVGATGNAPVPHLHFAVWKARPGGTRFWNGRAVNPYPLLAR